MIYFKTYQCLVLLLFISYGSAVVGANNFSYSQLSIEEKEVLQRYPDLKLGVGIAFPPFQFVTKESDIYQFKGIVSDIVRLLEQRLQIRMEPVFGIPFNQALELGIKRDIDLFPAVSKTPERNQFLTFTQPYLSYPLVIIGRDDSPFVSSIEDLQDKKLAIVKHLANFSKLQNDYPQTDFDFHFVKDVESVLTAVSLYDADYGIVNLAVASYFIQQSGLKNLRIVAPTPWENNKLRMAIRNDEPVLAGLIQKALNDITVAEKQAITQKWIALEYKTMIDPWIMKYIIIPGGLFIGILLLAFILRNVRLKQEILRRQMVEQQLIHAANHDSLTQLPNRALFIDRLKQSLKSARRNKTRLAVLFMDLDKFKPINDNYGHSEGDLVLKDIAIRLKQKVRASDTVARFGGDEFVILLNNVENEKAVTAITEKLLASLTQPYIIEQNHHWLEVSIGTVFYPEHGDTVDLLLSRADCAMYVAKNSKEEHIVTYHPDFLSETPDIKKVGAKQPAPSI